jgi:hypothetical protein
MLGGAAGDSEGAKERVLTLDCPKCGREALGWVAEGFGNDRLAYLHSDIRFPREELVKGVYTRVGFNNPPKDVCVLRSELERL